MLTDEIQNRVSGPVMDAVLDYSWTVLFQNMQKHAMGQTQCGLTPVIKVLKICFTVHQKICFFGRFTGLI